MSIIQSVANGTGEFPGQESHTKLGPCTLTHTSKNKTSGSTATKGRRSSSLTTWTPTASATTWRFGPTSIHAKEKPRATPSSYNTRRSSWLATTASQPCSRAKDPRLFMPSKEGLSRPSTERNTDQQMKCLTRKKIDNYIKKLTIYTKGVLGNYN